MPLTQEQNNMYAASFKDADLNGDGKISAAELKALLCDKIENVTDAEAQNIIDGLDNDGDGFLQFDEYIEVVNEFVTDKMTRDDMLAAFEHMDADGNGHITKDELKDFMKKAGQRISKKELKQMMKEADVNDDGKVNYQEFLSMVAN